MPNYARLSVCHNDFTPTKFTEIVPKRNPNPLTSREWRKVTGATLVCWKGIVCVWIKIVLPIRTYLYLKQALPSCSDAATSSNTWYGDISPYSVVARGNAGTCYNIASLDFTFYALRFLTHTLSCKPIGFNKINTWSWDNEEKGADMDESNE